MQRFYELLNDLRRRFGGYRYLKDCNSDTGQPERGVYFFFEHGEERRNCNGLRVIRVGTHGVSVGSRTSLWDRLRQHKGTQKGAYPDGGNHRGSIFRLHVGTALLNQGGYPEELRETWGKRGTADRKVRGNEYILECAVSSYIRNLPLLWLNVLDDPGSGSDRKLIEANAVALLSNYRKPSDPPSPTWLGRSASLGFGTSITLMKRMSRCFWNAWSDMSKGKGLNETVSLSVSL